ncbi:MAG TPA: protein translocase subunit SecD, partial [Anaerolineales bacterium]|nr:protein translocase subunit SecD [Anaerolineales bacterium]
MTKRNWQTLILIAIILVIGIYLVLPGTTRVPLLNNSVRTVLGLDLGGGVQALLEADLPEASVTAENMNTARQIVENRVNGLGVTDAVVQQAGATRILVELPGETDPEAVLSTLRETGLLEFVDFSSVDPNTAFSLVGTTIATDFAQTAEQASASPGQVYHTVLTGAELEDAGVTVSQTGTYEVTLSFKGDGISKFSEYTTNNVGKILAIVLDKQIISAPSISVPITDGAAVIQGTFTYEEANALAVQLRYGSLPIPLKVVESRTVNPTLGEDSLQKSIRAGMIGFVIVFLFMAIYYRLPGLISIIGIIFYGIIDYAIFRTVPVTLTLPGIAGVLLSTGSALDANILVFERLKEELRAGRNLTQAFALAYQRAWPSIRDSNIATLIT